MDNLVWKVSSRSPSQKKPRVSALRTMDREPARPLDTVLARLVPPDDTRHSVAGVFSTYPYPLSWLSEQPREPLVA